MMVEQDAETVRRQQQQTVVWFIWSVWLFG
jgi:hypothetical protein